MLQVPGWLLLVYLVFAQGISALDYELGVRLGTQESPEAITEVGAAFWYGFAFGDLVTYIPLLCIGLIGYMRRAAWGRLAFAAALGITIYWPIVCLAAMVKARGAAGWNLPSEVPYWIVCIVIELWGAWALWVVFTKSPHERAEAS